MLRKGVIMSDQKQTGIVDGAKCKVIGGVHAGKSGTVRDINTSKTGHVTVTVVQANGERFKTLAKNVVVIGAKNHN
jgi:ribosomal protein S4E